MNALDHDRPGLHFQGARAARERLFDAPDWQALDGQRPRREEFVEDGQGSHGKVGSARLRVQWTRVSSEELCARGSWEHSKLSCVLTAVLLPVCPSPSSFPSAPHARFDPQPFRVLLLRRLWLQLPSSSRSCRCGSPLDSSGHHRAACAVAGVLSRRGVALESAAARVCREAGGRVTSNVRVQDMDLAAPDRLDNRRIEVMVDGLPLFHGAQLAVDTTMVSPLRRDGSHHPRCADISGAALTAARRRKEATYPELHVWNGRTRLVVLGAEVGGRWSDESAGFVRHLANAKARGEPPVLRGRAQQAWMHRWSSLLACSAAKALALSLMERRGGQDGTTRT